MIGGREEFGAGRHISPAGAGVTAASRRFFARAWYHVKGITALAWAVAKLVAYVWAVLFGMNFFFNHM